MTSLQLRLVSTGERGGAVNIQMQKVERYMAHFARFPARLLELKLFTKDAFDQ